MTAPGASGAWSTLLPVALVGTERHAGAQPTWPGDAGSLIAQALQTASQPATGVLRAAGVLAASNLAGTLGTPIAADALPMPAAPDTLPELIEPRLVALAAWTLAQGPQRLAHDVLHAIAAARMRLPTPLLPAALDASRRSLALRPKVTAVLGARGLWLASKRDVWQHAAGVQADGDGDGDGDDARWSDGSLDQRREFLRRERARSALAARQRLEAALSELPAPERADLLGVLAEGLSMDDEPLLERLRADRSREVRQVALSLLLRLPQAAHPRRAVQRVTALMTHERALLRKRWAIDAPDAWRDEWAADNVEPERPKQDVFGERAWWLWQIARQVPLRWWCDHTGMTPTELLEWAAKGDWAKALAYAWHDALLATHDAAWAEAFVDHWPKSMKGIVDTPVMAMLEPAARSARWLAQMNDKVLDSGVVLPSMIEACAPPQTLSPELSQALASRVRERLSRPDAAQAWMLRSHLPELACILDASSLRLLADMPRSVDETPATAEMNQTVAQIVAVRQAFASLSTFSATEGPST